MPTRLPNGLSTQAEGKTFAEMGLPFPLDYHTFLNDFDSYDLADWIITTTEIGAGAATEAIANADGGVLVLTNAAGDNDNDFLQFSGGTSATAVETFLFASGKKMFFESRLQVSDATQSDFVMGLQITDTTPLATTDGVYFYKVDGSSDVNLLVTKNSTSTTTLAGTVVAATYIKLGFAYDGLSEISVFLDGVKVGTSVITNMPDDEELTISFGIQNGEAVAKTMSIDYVFCAKER